MVQISADALGMVRDLLVVIVSAAAILLAFDNWPGADDEKNRLERDHMLGGHRQVKAARCPRCQ